MKRPSHFTGLTGPRAAFCEWYNTKSGNLLLEIEAAFLCRFLRVSYNQLVLQVGSLGWEHRFVDEDLFRNVIVVDRTLCCQDGTQKVIGEIQQLPIASESVDTIIMPHTLEFENDQHEVLREVARVLKPEGQVLLLGFNPWSLYGLVRLMPLKRRKAPWCGNFVSRRRVIDSFRLLNFEMGSRGGFYIQIKERGSRLLENQDISIMSLAYAVKAIKRRYTLIPLDPLKATEKQFVAGGTIEPSSRSRING